MSANPSRQPTATHTPPAAGGPCPACERVRRAVPGIDPFFLASMRESVAILHKHQRYAGWCTLWLRDHTEHLGLLSAARQARLAEDVRDLAAAIHRAFDGEGAAANASGTTGATGTTGGPIRINYECLGNVVPHVHWHLIPRRPTDPDPGATVWVRPPAETDCGVDDALRDRLVARLRAELATT